ncbi:MAG: hypothetical protein FJ221_14230 [Lentisphaerae bacterium]|nr:hypothetical protein [Lentisphaerota bacterium]
MKATVATISLSAVLAGPTLLALEPPQPAVPTAQTRAKIEAQRRKIAALPVPAGLVRRTLNVGAVEREFFIHIPEPCKGKASPVVFALHGGAAASGLAMHLKVDYTQAADRGGFVVVYPSGTEGWNNGVAHKYTGGVNSSDDLGFFRAMFDTLIAEGVVDAKRIYITGGSNGGVMTYKLLSEMADRIAGAGIVVATLPAIVKTWPKPSRPVPIVLMLGTKDPMMPWDGTRGQQSAQATIDYWKAINGCTGESVKEDFPDNDPNDGCRVRSERWEGKATVLFYTLEGHGHGFPMQKGAFGEGTGPKTRDISAPEELWKFFRSVAQSIPAQPTAKP